LLESKVTPDKLKSQSRERHSVRLVEASYPRDEIIACAIEIKNKIKDGIDPNDIALLVPKNRYVRSAIDILKGAGVPVSAKDSVSFFDSLETKSMLDVIRVVSNPFDSATFGRLLFDRFSNIPPLLAHKFIHDSDSKYINLESALDKKQSLFLSPIENFIGKLATWVDNSRDLGLYELVQKIGSEFLLDTAQDHEELVKRVEVIRTFLHLALYKIEKNPKITLKEFIEFLDRLESYGEHIPLAVFSADIGVKVLTLHGSKGLEFDFVWIAHMDEKSLMSSKNMGFTLPSLILEKIEKKDEDIAKRELYVAITRAKRFCNISYSLNSYTGGEMELANIIKDLPDEIFERVSAEETEKSILSVDPKMYVEGSKNDKKNVDIKDLVNLVKGEYTGRRVSVSLLNNFFECPWKWYFRNLLQLPEPKNESLIFGDRVHKAIDQILKLDKKPSEKNIMDFVAGDKEAFKIVSTWVSKRLDKISKKRENEQPVPATDERFPHLNIYGKIDLIENLDKDNLRVTDFKTGSVKKKSEIEKLDEDGRLSNLMRQLTMYSYLLQKNPKWKKDVRESRLEFVEAKTDKESIYDTVIQLEQIEMLVKDIEDYDRALSTGEWVERKCNFKPYGNKDQKCEYCELSKIYQ
jgi:DNA helicase-2/ATP-dependent DNA helicase PcrA